MIYSLFMATKPTSLISYPASLSQIIFSRNTIPKSQPKENVNTYKWI
jgi:hypothetical protein